MLLKFFSFFFLKSLVLLLHLGYSSRLFFVLEKAVFTKEFEPFYTVKTESGLGKTADGGIMLISSNS